MTRDARSRWAWRAVAVALVAAASIGCNPLMAPFYAIYGHETEIAPECPLEPKAKGAEVKVAVLVTHPGNQSEDFIGVERQIAAQVSQKLLYYGAQAQQNIKTVSAAKLERYQAEHPDWQTKHPTEIARHFEADYVVSIHVKAISLYETGSRHLYRGRASMAVETHKVGGDEPDPIHSKELTSEYPKGHSPDVNDMPPAKFKEKFLSNLGFLVTCEFVPRKTADDFKSE